MPVISAVLFLTEPAFHICSLGLAQYGEACDLDGKTLPITWTSTQQCRRWPVRLWELVTASGV